MPRQNPIVKVAFHLFGQTPLFDENAALAHRIVATMRSAVRVEAPVVVRMGQQVWLPALGTHRNVVVIFKVVRLALLYSQSVALVAAD